MFDFVLVEGVVLLIIATTIIRNIFTNQKYQIPFTIACVVSIVLSYFLVAHNWLGYFDFCQKYLSLGSLYEKFGPVFLETNMKGFYLLVTMALIAIIIFAIIYIALRLVFIPSNKKYLDNPDYIMVHTPWISLVMGIVKAAIFVIIYLVVLDLFLPATRMSLDQSWLFGVFTKYDVIAKHIQDFASAHVGAPFE